MKQFFLLSLLLWGLIPNLGKAADRPGRPNRLAVARSQVTAPSATSPVITISPASATYTVGQSVTLTITSGTNNLAYSLLLYDDPSGSLSGNPLPYILTSK